MIRNDATEHKETASTFYADDGLIENANPRALQQDVNIITDLFLRVGLKANEKKTKFMVIQGPPASKALSQTTYDDINRRKQRRAPLHRTCAERKRRNAECTICGKSMRETSLQRHMTSQHKTLMKPKYEQRPEGILGTFILDNFTKGRNNKCPYPGCNGGGKDTFGIYRHFASRHPQADITISGD